MVDYQRQLLDELMGRNRNLDPGEKAKEKSWKNDSDNCRFFLVSQREKYRLCFDRLERIDTSSRNRSRDLHKKAIISKGDFNVVGCWIFTLIFFLISDNLQK